MTRTEMYIRLDGLKFHARHGVDFQETVVGNFFHTDIRLKVDFTQASLTDKPADMLNYADVFQAVKQEMETPSKLLEHVCRRIVDRIFRDFPGVEEVDILLQKENPPMGADIFAAGVEMHCCR